MNERTVLLRAQLSLALIVRERESSNFVPFNYENLKHKQKLIQTQTRRFRLKTFADKQKTNLST
jgi:hypothetical protein